jgi:cell division protein FtsL
MTRFNFVLLLALLASSLYLVRVSYDARRLFAELDRAQVQARQLETEFGRLEAERQAQATPSRVEKAARDKLRMHTATPAITAYVSAASWPADIASAAAPRAGGRGQP